MRIVSLNLWNIGPFRQGHIDFITENDKTEKPPVTIITGENGTGKTIILDAIRGLFFGDIGKSKLERDIIVDINSFSIEVKLLVNNEDLILSSKTSNALVHGQLHHDETNFSKKFHLKNQEKDWVVDYWTSKLATDKFDIKNLEIPDPENYLLDALSGIHKNVEVTQLITYFDYLRSSEDPKEEALGEALYEKLKDIIELSLNNGKLKYVARKSLQPVIEQNGQEVTLDKLSSGNLYLIQRMVSMLGKMYSVNVLSKKPISELCNAPGVLLIDEAENHLHPKWQKTFVNNILKIFPNLQIILTTHSPFIVASVENARIYVCKSRTDHCEIVNETDEYANKPVDEILLSPLFNTQPFNEQISGLITKRKKAIEAGNIEGKNKIEQKLKAINPEYFSYFDVEDLLGNITGK